MIFSWNLKFVNFVGLLTFHFSNIAEWLLVDEFGLIDRFTEIVYDSWFWWISNHIVRYVRFDLTLKSSFATYCPKVLRTHPLLFSSVSALITRRHLLDRALVLGCNTDTWCLKRVLRHFLELLVATVGPWHDRCHINRLPLSHLVIVVTANIWEVFISGVDFRTQVGQHRVDIFAWERHKLLTVVFTLLRAVNWINWKFSSIFRSFLMFFRIVRTADISYWFSQEALNVIIWTIFIAFKLLMSFGSTKSLNFVFEWNLKHILLLVGVRGGFV